ncbi:MAG: hypothetical protein JO246_00895 [Frankiaceae bacterium]|nr:hypothetical protein [Frankiaceae bacterium]MBV9870001.1 hypothetical protein [Frankiaceae bacterium]
MTTIPSAQAATPAEPTKVEITPSVGFGWIMQGIRPYLGYVFVGLGLLALFLGWWGASGTPIVAKQVPYLASDGLLAVVLIAIGNRIFLIDDLRRDSGRLDRLEDMVTELHAVLLSRTDAVADSPTTKAASSAKPYLALATGTSYHLPGCAMVASKSAQQVGKADVTSRNLKPCRMCTPPAVKK